MQPVNLNLKQKVKDMINYMAKTELDKILKILKGDYFFNLSGKPIDKNVSENLKSGKKFFTLNIKRIGYIRNRK